MTKDDLIYLDSHKNNDKEWRLLRNEENIFIKTVDDIKDLSMDMKDNFLSLKNTPLKGKHISQFNKSTKELRKLIINKDVIIS